MGLVAGWNQGAPDYFAAITGKLLVVSWLSCAVYSSLFLVFGMWLKNPVIYGLIFTFGWEYLVAILPGQLQDWTVGMYPKALFIRWANSDPVPFFPWMSRGSGEANPAISALNAAIEAPTSRSEPARLRDRDPGDDTRVPGDRDPHIPPTGRRLNLSIGGGHPRTRWKLSFGAILLRFTGSVFRIQKRIHPTPSRFMTSPQPVAPASAAPEARSRARPDWKTSSSASRRFVSSTASAAGSSTADTASMIW